MTRLLLDTSVVIKWFHTTGESEVTEARALREAHISGEIQAHVLDLAMYELGNVLCRALRWPSDDVADQLDDVQMILGPPLAMSNASFRLAAGIAEQHGLSFYDASWPAAAQDLGVALISADRKLVRAQLAESPTGVTRRLSLSPT